LGNKTVLGFYEEGDAAFTLSHYEGRHLLDGSVTIVLNELHKESGALVFEDGSFRFEGNTEESARLFLAELQGQLDERYRRLEAVKDAAWVVVEKLDKHAYGSVFLLAKAIERYDALEPDDDWDEDALIELAKAARGAAVRLGMMEDD